MPRKGGENRYSELSALLRGWRSEKFRSALALFKDRDFSFSYSAYADFERGSSLPTPEALLEIARALGHDPAPAIRAWAREQMPTPELKACFADEPRVPPAVPRPNPEHAPTLDNTWVFGPTELRLVSANPDLMQILTALIMAYPDPVPIAELAHPEAKTWIAPLLKSGHLLREASGIRLRYQYIHIPRTPEWQDFRNGNIRRAVDALLESSSPERLQAGQGYHGLVHRTLRADQVRKWTQALQKLEDDFLADPYTDGTRDTEIYALVLALGPRLRGKA